MAAQDIRILFDEIDLEEDANIPIILTRLAQISIDNAEEQRNVLRIIVDQSLDYSEFCETRFWRLRISNAKQWRMRSS